MPDSPRATFCCHGTEAVRRAKAEARAILARLTDPSRTSPAAPDLLAMVTAGLGETEAALTWLRKSCGQRDPGIAWIKVHPGLDTLRNDPRFAQIVRCVGLTP
jgi:hypothetical protein